MNHIRLMLVPVVLLLIAMPAAAQQRATTDLPITRIVLFSSGVGYFQRAGKVEGNTRIDLQFHTQNINDLLKSLVLQDTAAGRISTVNYDNRDPIDKTLKSFAIDLTSNPTLGQLLGQVRGERVEVTMPGEPGTIKGIIVGVEKQRRPVVRDQVAEVEQLNLLTQEGLRGVDLGHVQRVQLTRPELEQEFRKALEVLALGHDKLKKTVSLNFLGSGKRGVRVGYVVESPIWKTSYRLAIDREGKDNKAFLQGWAIVENTTDDDWNDVRMGLVSGRPISFRMDLYEPLYVPRPIVEPELFASLRPPSYSGTLVPSEDERQRSGQAGGGGRFPATAMAPRRRGRDIQEQLKSKEEALGESEKPMLTSQGVATAAVATELGEYFKYELEQPVTLPRQKSALIPIVNDPVEAARVSIYNEGVHVKFPLLGLRFKNTTNLHLLQGPITVFEGNTYAGDARVGDLQPKETRLISYAVDLGTEVLAESPNSVADLVAIKIYKGILHSTHKLRSTRSYTVKNRSEHGRLVLVEYPYRPDWKLVTPEKPAERSRDVYRFEVKAEPNKTEKLTVVEEQERTDELAILNMDDDNVRFFLRSRAGSAKVKEALEQAVKLRAELGQTQREIATQELALQVIEKDQERMRANMARVPQTSEAYKRYLKKFDDQETEIEKRRSTITTLQASAADQRKAYESFILNLNVE
jgi:hypothetical protein